MIRWSQLFLALCFLAPLTAAAAEPTIRDALLLHASFDKKAAADFAKGDAQIYTAKSLKRESVEPGLHGGAVALRSNGGRHGGCLTFKEKTNQIVFFKGAGNLPKVKPGFQGAFSFWLKLTPDADLPPGYVDPLQITDKKWNDASFFVDFDKELPRTFRLGVFSDFKFWNPKNRKYDDIPDAERPLVPVKKPPFNRDKWTHVGITFRDFNRPGKEGVATLYLNGKSQGDVKRKQHFTWGEEKLAIMLGIYYVGGLDDFAVFDRDLTAAEIQQLYELPNGVKSLKRSGK